jgi:hypothetical protein
MVHKVLKYLTKFVNSERFIHQLQAIKTLYEIGLISLFSFFENPFFLHSKAQETFKSILKTLTLKVYIQRAQTKKAHCFDAGISQMRKWARIQLLMVKIVVSALSMSSD